MIRFVTGDNTLAIYKNNQKYIQLNEKKEWTIGGFHLGEKMDEKKLSDKELMCLMQAFQDLGTECLWDTCKDKKIESVVYLTKSIDFAPTSKIARQTKKFKKVLSESYKYRAKANLEIGEPNKALSDINKSITFDNSDKYDAYSTRAEIQLKNGNQGEACLDFIKSQKVLENYKSDYVESRDPGFLSRIWKSIFDPIFRK